MKHILFVLHYLCCLIATSGQSNYNEAMNQGDEAFRAGQYKMAINKYFAAEAFDPSKKDTVKKKVNIVFDMIETLRKKAEDAETKATKSKTEAENALARANKLIQAFYFYEDKFALTIAGSPYDLHYYFINKTGDILGKFGEWNKAEPFDPLTGFAKVSREDKEPMLLDTFGNTYPVAYDLAEMNNKITALDLSKVKLDFFPQKAIEYSQLRILILEEFDPFKKPKNIKALPVEIGNLKNLEYLDLQSCNLNSIPGQIGELKKLWGLNLLTNKLTSVPAQIGELRNLTTLYLGYNELDSLPEQIFELKNLKVLILEQANMKTLPMEIGNLKNIIWLACGKNHLSTLPVELFELKNLEKLSLNDNKLTSLPAQIGELKDLTHLDLSDNPLVSLPVQIGKLKNLRTLALSSTLLPKTEIEKIKKLLPNCYIEY